MGYSKISPSYPKANLEMTHMESLFAGYLRRVYEPPTCLLLVRGDISSFALNATLLHNCL